MSGKKIDAYNVESISYSHNSNDQVLKHKHDNFEIIYYFDGKGLSTVYGETVFNFRYNADSILIVPPNLVHEEYAIEETRIVCNLIDIPIKNANKPLLFKKSAKNKVVFEKIKKQMMEINQLWFKRITKKEDTAEQINELLLHLGISVFNLINRSKKDKNDYVDQFSEVVKDYVKSSYLSKINYTILAEEFGYSYDRFRHIFLENTGMTLHNYQKGLKFDHAKKLLTLTNMKIGDIAKVFGHSNTVRFCEWFSNMAGISPRQYRYLSEDLRWGVVLNINDVKEKKIPPVFLDGQVGNPEISLAYALLKYFDKKGYAKQITKDSKITKEKLVELLDSTENAKLVFLSKDDTLKELLLDESVRKLLIGKGASLYYLLTDNVSQDLVDVSSLGVKITFLVAKPLTINLEEVITLDNPVFSKLYKKKMFEVDVISIVMLMFAVFGNNGMFTENYNCGFITENGVTTLEDSAGIHTRIRINTDDELKEQIYSAILKLIRKR